MKVVTAPEKFDTRYPSIFLAGGITNCKDWQSQVINYLSEYFNDTKIVIYSPRRENFPIDDPSAAEEQITWEYEHLNNARIFTMYFCNSESDQPICMYELGRYVEHMKHYYLDDYKDRIVISIENGYKREKDVVIQMGLLGIPVLLNATPQIHAELIKRAYMNLY